jgi:hypothetical protein
MDGDLVVQLKTHVMLRSPWRYAVFVVKPSGGAGLQSTHVPFPVEGLRVWLK